MNYSQSIIISAAGTLTSQALFKTAFDFADVLKFVALTACFIVPINNFCEFSLCAHKCKSAYMAQGPY